MLLALVYRCICRWSRLTPGDAAPVCLATYQSQLSCERRAGLGIESRNISLFALHVILARERGGWGLPGSAVRPVLGAPSATITCINDYVIPMLVATSEHYNFPFSMHGSTLWIL